MGLKWHSFSLCFEMLALNSLCRYVFRNGLELRAIALLQPPKCWDQRSMPPWLTLKYRITTFGLIYSIFLAVDSYNTEMPLRIDFDDPVLTFYMIFSKKWSYWIGLYSWNPEPMVAIWMLGS